MTTKPFDISKRLVWEAYKRVKSNAGAAGIDGQSLEVFERDLADNLYRIWNRMASGSYFPPPVRAVSIPKKADGERILGVPTVADRIAQTVVKLVLEPQLEPHFHEDSYGYRPGKSAHQALAITRRRCWWHAWVLEFDIRGLFDNIDHELLMKAIRHHTDCSWVLLYVERWLTAPMQYGVRVDCQSGQRHAARRPIVTAAVESVSSLRIRSLDGRLPRRCAVLPICR